MFVFLKCASLPKATTTKKSSSERHALRLTVKFSAKNRTSDKSLRYMEISKSTHLIAAQKYVKVTVLQNNVTIRCATSNKDTFRTILDLRQQQNSQNSKRNHNFNNSETNYWNKCIQPTNKSG